MKHAVVVCAVGIGCEATELRARWCEGELAEARRQRASVRQPWPDEGSSETPEQWTSSVDEALAQCGMEAQVELVDCSEYPCSAALRPTTVPETDEAFARQMEALMATARTCKPLRDAFGVADAQVTTAIDVWRLDAPCKQGRERFFALTVLAPDGPAYALMSRQRSDDEERDFSRWLYRRADDLSAMWLCGPEAAP